MDNYMGMDTFDRSSAVYCLNNNRVANFTANDVSIDGEAFTRISDSSPLYDERKYVNMNGLAQTIGLIKKNIKGDWIDSIPANKVRMSSGRSLEEEFRDWCCDMKKQLPRSSFSCWHIRRRDLSTLSVGQ